VKYDKQDRQGKAAFNEALHKYEVQEKKKSFSPHGSNPDRV
jgi:hypothetical protein